MVALALALALALAILIALALVCMRGVKRAEPDTPFDEPSGATLRCEWDEGTQKWLRDGAEAEDLDEVGPPPPLPTLGVTTTIGGTRPEFAQERYLGQLEEAYGSRGEHRTAILRNAAKKLCERAGEIQPGVSSRKFDNVARPVRLLLLEADLETVSYAVQTLTVYKNMTTAELSGHIERSVPNCTNAVVNCWDPASELPLADLVRASQNSSLEDVCAAVVSLRAYLQAYLQASLRDSLYTALQQMLLPLYSRITQEKSVAARRLQLICPRPPKSKATCQGAAVRAEMRAEMRAEVHAEPSRAHALLANSGMGWGITVTPYLCFGELAALAILDIRTNAAIAATVPQNIRFENLSKF